MQLVWRELDSGLFVNPTGSFTKYAEQEINVEMGFIGQREVEILGEPVGFEVALFEAGPALENPVLRQNRMIEDAGKNPAQDVVFFDNAWKKSKVGGGGEKFPSINHARAPPSTSWESTDAKS